MGKDLHSESFDDGTKDKLLVFELYIREWLPVFLATNKPIWRTVNLVDFFAGPGMDTDGTPGTPALIFDELIPYKYQLERGLVKVNIYLNEYKKQKYVQLVKYIEERKKEFPNVSVVMENKDFGEVFAQWYPIFNNTQFANLLLLDQNGIRHVTGDVFQKIISMKQTDYLFFVSSSFVGRFSEHERFRQYLQLNKADVDSTPWPHMHRLIHNYYQEQVPLGVTYYLGRFSLRKPNGQIYGLIFGSGHPYGMEKFLVSCWKVDPERGEANYNIDDDKLHHGQYDAFSGEVPKPKKVQVFENDLIAAILEKRITTDKELYLFTITNGFLPKHTKSIVEKLVSEKKLVKCNLNLSHKVCKADAVIKNIELI